jgi:hypothetical protein
MSVLPPQRRISRTERLAEFFRARPGNWIDGRELANVAGTYAWRTRISDLRRAPFYMRIDNRQRHVTTPDQQQFVISEYIFLGGRIPTDVPTQRARVELPAGCSR